MVRDYGYYKQLLSEAVKRQPLSLDRVNLFGGRNSSKTWSSLEFIISMCLVAKTYVYAFRYMNDDKKELWKQILEVADTFPGLSDTLHLHLTDRVITFPNGSAIDLRGLHKQRNDEVKLTGLSGKNGFDYGIAFAEERYEINDKEWSAVLQAIRGFDNFLEIHAANPWIFSNDYVQYCHNKYPFHLETLKTEGQQFKCLDVNHKGILGMDDFTTREVFHYTNFKVNHFIKQVDKNKLIQSAEQNEFLANTIIYGYPGSIEGSILGDLVNNIQWTTYEDGVECVDKLSGGVDYGLMNDATAATLIGFTPGFGEQVIFDEYEHSNGTKRYNKGTWTKYDIEDYVDDILWFYMEHIDLIKSKGGIDISVDNSEHGFIQLLNKKAKELNVYQYIKFNPSYKPEIVDRIVYERAALSMKKIWAVKGAIPLLVDELNGLQWKKTNNIFHFTSLIYVLLK